MDWCENSARHNATQLELSHPLCINPIVNSTTNFKIKVRLRLSNVTFNTAVNETWVNVGVSLWMQRPNTDWNSSGPQLEVGLKLF